MFKHMQMRPVLYILRSKCAIFPRFPIKSTHIQAAPCPFSILGKTLGLPSCVLGLPKCECWKSGLPRFEP